VYDLLEAISQIAQTVTSHPLKKRLIAQSQIKTDAIGSDGLTTLVRGNFLARVHVPSSGDVVICRGTSAGRCPFSSAVCRDPHGCLETA